MKRLKGLITLTVILATTITMAGCSENTVSTETESDTTQTTTAIQASGNTTDMLDSGSDLNNKLSQDKEELSEYLRKVKGSHESLEKSRERIGDLLTTPMPGDPDWNHAVAMEIVTISGIADSLMELEKTSLVDDNFHKIVMSAAEDYVYFSDNFGVALDNLDADLLKDCVERMKTGEAFLKMVVLELESQNNL